MHVRKRAPNFYLARDVAERGRVRAVCATELRRAPALDRLAHELVQRDHDRECDHHYRRELAAHLVEKVVVIALDELEVAEAQVPVDKVQFHVSFWFSA